MQEAPELKIRACHDTTSKFFFFVPCSFHNAGFLSWKPELSLARSPCQELIALGKAFACMPKTELLLFIAWLMARSLGCIAGIDGCSWWQVCCCTKCGCWSFLQHPVVVQTRKGGKRWGGGGCAWLQLRKLSEFGELFVLQRVFLVASLFVQ